VVFTNGQIGTDPTYFPDQVLVSDFSILAWSILMDVITEEFKASMELGSQTMKESQFSNLPSVQDLIFGMKGHGIF
jgi:hypothetical protein